MVPYRDSKLTMILKDCLGGSAFAVLVVCVSPSQRQAAETLSALRFGQRAKAMKNAPLLNATTEALGLAVRAARQAGHAGLRVLGFVPVFRVSSSAGQPLWAFAVRARSAGPEGHGERIP